jgi:hypothetical protein
MQSDVVEDVMLHGSMIPRSVRRMFDERAEAREPAESQTAVMEVRGRKHMVRLANLSSSGAMVIFSLMPHIGEEVVLHLLGRGRVRGQVCWVRDGGVGVNFASSEE